MAAFIQRKRQEKDAYAEDSASKPQNSADVVSKQSNVLRRIKSSPLIRLVSTSAKKRDRDNEFPFPVVVPPLPDGYLYSNASRSRNKSDTDQNVPPESAIDGQKFTRSDLRITTQTKPSLDSAGQSLSKHQSEPTEINPEEVGLAITQPAQDLNRSHSEDIFLENTNDRPPQVRHEQALSHRRAVHSRTVGAPATSSSSQDETAATTSREPRRDLRPQGPREIRNTLELFPKPRTTEMESSFDLESPPAASDGARRTSSPLLPLETSPSDEVPSRLDEISRLTIISPDRVDLAAQKHRDEDARVLWSLQESRQPHTQEALGPNATLDSKREDAQEHSDETYQARRGAPQEGVIEPQRSKSTSVSSSDRSSTVDRGQSSTSTARQSESAASTTTHGSPPPQYLFTHPSKETARDRAERRLEPSLMPQKSDEIQSRPQTAPDDDRRPRAGVKQRFPVVPQRLPGATGAKSFSATSTRDRPANVTPLQPVRSQTDTSETSLPRSVNPNYKVTGTPTFIRDGSFFRPLPPYPRGQNQEPGSIRIETCSCSKTIPPVTNLSIEELRAQNAMLRAALEAIIGP